MFQLIVLEDKVTCHPEQINRDPSQVLIEQIEIKYVNRVLPNIGLGVAFFDFVSVNEPYLYPGSGSPTRLVVFRLVVFKPFIGEVMTGRVTRVSREGLRVSLEFFDDITISGAHLQHPSSYDPVSNRWTWNYEDGDSTAPFVTELGDVIRFKIRSVSFTSLTPTKDGVMATTTSETYELPRNTTVVAQPDLSLAPLVRRRSLSVDLTRDQETPSAMQITGSTNDFGLGVVTWW